MKHPPNPGLQFCANLPFENAVLVVDVVKLSGYYAKAAPVFTEIIQKELNRSGRTMNAASHWIHTAILEIYRVAEVFQERELDGRSTDVIDVSNDFNTIYISPYMHNATLKEWVIDAGYELYKLFPWRTTHTQIVIYRQGLLYIYVDTTDPYAEPKEG